MEYGVVLEGATRLKVPKGGGIKKSEEVFYNPHMMLNRDITVALCRLLEPETFLDAMAGSGSRGIRVANESKAKVTVNDRNPKAARLIEENARLNGVDVEATMSDVRQINGRYDFVDLDPFGPPVAYIDSALDAVRHNGVLGVCATDTSALCGSYPKACERKYDSHPLRCDCFSEVGLRILLGFVARAALRHERGIEPLFCHSTRHYMRVQARLDGGHARTQKGLGFLQYCFKCMWRGYRSLGDLEEECGCGGRLNTAGPLWTGRFADPALCEKISKELLDGQFQSKAEALKLVGLVSFEQDLPLPHYDLHKLCRLQGCQAPSMESFFGRVQAEGFSIVRTHFNDTGFRSDMPVGALVEALKE